MTLWLRLQEKVSTWLENPLIRKLIYFVSFFIILTILIFGFWKISDWISDYKFNKKVKELELVQEKLSKENERLNEDNNKLLNEKTKLDAAVSAKSAEIKKLQMNYFKGKAKIIYVDKGLASTRSKYEKEISDINRDVPTVDRYRRLCESRKELGYSGGICGK